MNNNKKKSSVSQSRIETKTAFWLEVDCLPAANATLFFSLSSWFSSNAMFYCCALFVSSLSEAGKRRGTSKEQSKGRGETDSQSSNKQCWRSTLSTRRMKKRDRFCFLLLIAVVCWIKRRLFSTTGTRVLVLSCLRATYCVWLGRSPNNSLFGT